MRVAWPTRYDQHALVKHVAGTIPEQAGDRRSGMKLTPDSMGASVHFDGYPAGTSGLSLDLVNSVQTVTVDTGDLNVLDRTSLGPGLSAGSCGRSARMAPEASWALACAATIFR